MDSEKLNHWLQFLGMLGIMGSLVFVGLQVKQTDAIASLEGQEYAVQRHYDMLSLMTEFADVWQRGCSGEELSAAERVQFTSIFKVYQNNNFAGWRRLRLSRYRDGGSDYNINAIAANIHRYPGFAATYHAVEKWHNFAQADLGPSFKEYRRLIGARVEKLAKSKPDVAYSIELCGQT